MGFQRGSDQVGELGAGDWGLGTHTENRVLGTEYGVLNVGRMIHITFQFQIQNSKFQVYFNTVNLVRSLSSVVTSASLTLVLRR